MRESQSTGRVPRPSFQEHTAIEAARLLARRILGWQYFDYMMGLVMLANSICIGITIQAEIEGLLHPTLDSMENAFLTIYLLELILKLVAHGKRCFRDCWFIFDFNLVLCGALSSWIYKPFFVEHHVRPSKFIERLMVVRVIRLLRLVRALRMIRQFQSMWKLVYGMFTSCSTMVSTFSLMGLALFIFGCVGVEIITLDKDTFA